MQKWWEQPLGARDGWDWDSVVNAILVETKSAKEFLNVLTPYQPWWTLDVTRWVFRGQQNAEWKLQPSLLREDSLSRYFGERPPLHKRVSPDLQVYTSLYNDQSTPDSRDELVEKGAEYIEQGIAALRDFGRAGHQLGLLSEPWADDALDEEHGALAPYAHAQFPKYEYPFGGYAAIAQHHGIPTALLDWSTNPFVAAYFAGEATRGEFDTLAVWALDLAQFRERKKIIDIRYPTTKSEFIRAQSGLFTYTPGISAYWMKNGCWPGVDDVVWGDGVKFEGGKVRWEPRPLVGLRKITLPRTEATELIGLLRHLGVSRSSLMPTLDNVAKDTMEMGSLGFGE